MHAEFHISHQGIAIGLRSLVYITLRSRAIESFVWFGTVLLLVWVPDSGTILHKRANQRKVGMFA